MTVALERPDIAATKNARTAFLAFAIVLTGAVCLMVWLVPLNANDMLKWLFRFEDRGFWGITSEYYTYSPTSTDWRPLQLPFGYALYRLANGHEHLVFKGLLIVSVIGTAWLFVRQLPVRSWAEAAAAALALLILYAHHSFRGAVEGVYPWGVEIVLVACQVAVLGILLRERTIGSEIGALLISVFALVLNEKGGCVGATYIVGALVRMPGGTIRAAAGIFVAYLGVLALRLFVFRSIASLGGKRRDIIDGGNSYLFDAFAPVLNLLISDPRGGNFIVFPDAFSGGLGALIVVVSSLATTALIAIWAFAERKKPEAGLFPVLVVALLTTTIFGAYSTKDYIPILALTVYAVAAYYAVRWLFQAHHGVALVLACVLFFCWGVRFGGLGYWMVSAAHHYQIEWREAELYGDAASHDPRMTAPIIDRLRPQALWINIPHPARALPPFWVGVLRGWR
jgi:hypothetical protein